MRRHSVGTGRAGFSLVELLVAFALIIGIMAVIAAAFAAARRVVSDLKVADEMESKLRGGLIMLRDDLMRNHFDDVAVPGSQRKLSDVNFWDAQIGDPTNAGLPVPIPTGFFRIYQVGRPTPVVVGTEVPSSVMSGSSLHFTVFRPKDTPGNMFRTQVVAGSPLLTAGTAMEREARFQSLNGTVFTSPWGEVAWWLTPSGETTVPADGSPGQPLYVLRRRQRALWPLPLVSVSEVPDNVSEVSGPPTGAVAAQLNDTVRVAAPPFRFGMTPTAAAEANGPGLVANTDDRYAGKPTAPAQPYPSTTVEDIVIGDVLSFDVAVKLEGAADFSDLGDPTTVQQYTGGNPAYGAATGTYYFDTWTNQTVGRFSYVAGAAGWNTPGTYASIPLYRHATTGQKIRIRAIQITLRIWNQKDSGDGTKSAGTARQMTIVQEM